MRPAGMLHRGGRAEAVSKEDTAREANEFRCVSGRRKQMPAPVFEMGSWRSHLRFVQNIGDEAKDTAMRKG
jgi:hypothetical protein